MTPARKKRLALIVLMVSGIAIGVGFALKSLDENIMFFFTPSEVAKGKAPRDRLFRIGGMVVNGRVSCFNSPNGCLWGGHFGVAHGNC